MLRWRGAAHESGGIGVDGRPLLRQQDHEAGQWTEAMRSLRSPAPDDPVQDSWLGFNTAGPTAGLERVELHLAAGRESPVLLCAAGWFHSEAGRHERAAELFAIEVGTTALVPLPTTVYTEPLLFARIDAVGDGHLLVVPFRDCLLHNVDQMRHGRKVLVGGHGFLPQRLQPDGFRELMGHNLLVRSLDDLTRGAAFGLSYRPQDVQQLTSMGYRFVVLFDDPSLPADDYVRSSREIGRHFLRVASDGHGAAFDLILAAPSVASPAATAPRAPAGQPSPRAPWW